MNPVPTDSLEQARRFYEFIPRSVDPYRMVAVMEDHLSKARQGIEALDRTGRMTAKEVAGDIEKKITRAATMNTIMSFKPPRNLLYSL